jgi:hypothetical protein
MSEGHRGFGRFKSALPGRIWLSLLILPVGAELNCEIERREGSREVLCRRF